MQCPGEFVCAVFADGELPEAEAQAVAEHVAICTQCAAVVQAHRQEARLLVHSFQDLDVLEAQLALDPVMTTARSALHFAFGMLGAAVVLRLAFGILFGLELPAGFEWLDPRNLSVRLGVLATALAHVIENGGVYMTNTILAVSLAAGGAAVLAGFSRFVKRTPAAGALLGTILLMAVFSSSASAIDVRTAKDSTIPAGTTVDDTVIIAGDVININGIIKGDLIAAGRHVIITGTVEGDVIAAAQMVDVRGRVVGNVFGAGDIIQVGGQIDRNLYSYVRVFTLMDSAHVAGDITAFAAAAIADGMVGRDISAFAGTLDVRGEVARTVRFRGGRFSALSSARIGKLAAVVGANEDVRIEAGATVGSQDIQLREPAPSRYSTVGFYFWQAVRIATLFVAGLVLFWLFPSLLPGSSVIGREWLKAGGIGFAAAVAIPVAALIIAITVIGLPIGLSGFALWLAGLYAAKILVAGFLGRAVVKEGKAMSLLAGLILVVVAINLPYVGWLLNILLTCVGFGALLMLAYRQSGTRPQATA